MSTSRLRPYVGPLIALLVVLALGAGAVYAAIPNNGTYYACLTKSTGAIKVINYPKVKCAKGQTLIKWNQQGPAGPTGAQGPKGDQGPAGPADWNAIANKPAGFADGVDNGDTTRSSLVAVSAFLYNGQTGFVDLTYPVGLDVKVTLIPVQDNVVFALIPASSSQGEEVFYRSGGTMHQRLYFKVVSGGPGELRARVTVWNESYIAPAAVKKLVKATFHKGLQLPKGLKRSG